MADASFRDEQWEKRYDAQVKLVNEFCDRLRDEPPYLTVPYVAPHYDTSTARILSLFSNPGPHASGDKGSGFISRENDDGADARLSGVYESVGLTDGDAFPWNAYPWHGTEPHPNGLANHLIDEGIEPLKQLLDLYPGIHAVVAHGGDARRSMRRFTSPKFYGEYAQARGLEVFYTRHTSNRAFVLREPEKSIALEAVSQAYRDAMVFVGLEPIPAPAPDPATAPLTGSELVADARSALSGVGREADARALIDAYLSALSDRDRRAMLGELLLDALPGEADGGAVAETGLARIRNRLTGRAKRQLR